MLSYRKSVTIMNLIPFVSQLKEAFLNWIILDDRDRNHLKSVVEGHENVEIGPIIMALEQWERLQDFGAPGVDVESIVCDNKTLHEVIESSVILNEIILSIAHVKKAKIQNTFLFSF